MGFLNGRVTFTRYRISGQSPLPFGEEMLALAEQHVIGRHGATEATDGVSSGWAGGDHVLDLSFDLAKNVINDALHLAIRVDTDKIPSSLLRAYTQIETDALAKQNPSGLPTKAQRTEAKEAARLRQRPRRLTADSVASIITRFSGTARPESSTQARRARVFWSGSVSSFVRRSTAIWSR